MWESTAEPEQAPVCEGGASGDGVKEEPVGEGGAKGEEGEEGEGCAKGDEVKNDVKKEKEKIERSGFWRCGKGQM